ncbi:MlaD family protein [Citreimonas salinaria]|uniref:Phospholipid/cholesterol/gamma-HCH transport system substrate-binding protein n=1 Tax=Citreimonas salinaria TaxID=321339 RepID=A0A1H3LAL2_9RHOB|nr:MlaD family protein [Citreimonas salinaria]SDY61340.1 phospholipid/cholesterol/gamma-HCH transport system substrate-binding protein [Citreimonas salinaria]
METRANFILIGIFTLLGIIGGLGFAVWLSSVQLDRQYAYYGILFDDVSGLDSAGDVVFNGINVGRVTDMRIHDPDPSKVYVGIEVDATTPVREDTVAQLSLSGVTGVAYISLTNTSADAPPLTSDDGAPPIIPSRRSNVQQLVEDAPDLITEATNLLRQFQQFAGPENQAHVQNILNNLSDASAGLDQALTDFSDITRTVADATERIAGFGARLETLGEAAETTLGNADQTLASAAGAFDSAKAAIDTTGTAIDSAGLAFAEAETLMRDQVPQIAAQISRTVDALNEAIADVSERSVSTLDGFDQTAALLNARLRELEQTLSDASTSFNALSEASDSVDTLVSGNGTLMVADAREVLAGAQGAIDRIGTVMDQDVPAMVEEIRGAVSSAAAAVDTAARDLTEFTDGLTPLADDTRTAVDAAADLLQRASTTLAGIDGSLAAANRALGSAEKAFDSADEVISTDLGPVLSDIRAATDQIGGAADQVSADLPQITSDLRALIGRANDVVAQVQATVSDAAPGIRNFTGNGLNELTRLGAEARGLVQSLENLVRRIERDPARFLLDERVPEYRR